jgi:hypothetical protein
LACAAASFGADLLFRCAHLSFIATDIRLRAAELIVSLCDFGGRPRRGAPSIEGGNGLIEPVCGETGLGESVLLHLEGERCGSFLWRADRQSGLKIPIRRMQCDSKPIIRRMRLDLRRSITTGSDILPALGCLTHGRRSGR